MSSTSFEPVLLLVLLRTICNLSPPPAGWDAPPLSVDTSRESDIARVKYFINAVSRNAGEAAVSDTTFSNNWQQIRDTLMRLGGTDYGDAIDAIRNQEMDPLDEEHFAELLKQWKNVEDNIKGKLNELEGVMDASKEEGRDSSGGNMITLLAFYNNYWSCSCACIRENRSHRIRTIGQRWFRGPYIWNFTLYRGIHSGQTQRACAIWADLMAANYREIQNTFSKSQKIKQFLETEALNVEYLWKCSCLFTSGFIASYFVLSLYF